MEIQSNYKKGFTLLELLVVISIISLLATLALAQINNARENTRDARRKSDLRQIFTALELYYDDYNLYPRNNGWIHCSTYTNSGTYTSQDLESTLEDYGYMQEVPFDPMGVNKDCAQDSYGANDYIAYLFYRPDATDCFSGERQNYCLYANLENPTAEDIAYQNSLPCDLSRYGMDYAICSD